MGLLDDAIREHLDLKRRRGADPAEVERAQQEALGPVRRHPEHAEEPAFDSEASLDDEGLAYDDELEHDWEESAHESPAAQAETSDYARPAGDVAEPHWGASDEAFVREDPVADPPQAFDAPPAEHPPSPPGPPPAHSAAEDTAEYDVELEHAPHQRREDMLEETPEFLQDTPDHDRLWFEQRPPRDFNFDS
jgi:hypothetical protein